VTDGEDNDEDNYGYSAIARAQYEQLRVALSDPIWSALNDLLLLIFDEPARARERSERLQGARPGSFVWKLDAVAGEEKITVMWSLRDDPELVWMGVWPPV
jgi:hypothetical protein